MADKAKTTYHRELTTPIKSIDEEVKISENGHEYYLARCKNVLSGPKDKKVLHMGGSVALEIEDVNEYGIEGLIGARVNRWVAE